jgi:Flp pilus assembly CpaE family ATPase
LKIVLNRASEFGVSSTAQTERVLGLNIDFSVNSDYRTVASAVNSGVPVSALRGPAELQHQLEAIARALCGVAHGRSSDSAADGAAGTAAWPPA